MDPHTAHGDTDAGADSDGRTLYALTVDAARRRLQAGEISAVELTESVLERIAAVDPTLRAFITVTPDVALEQARRADARRRQGEDTPLLGVPMAVKDLIATAGIRTTAGSRILENFVPPYNATAIDRLYAAGAVLVGKTNLDEFAMGSSTENSAFFATRNPWDVGRVPGGSSGGSAAAVAADATLFALGTDTGGSVRQPAALCGVVGLKPTYGRVSRYGLIAYASSLDQIGSLTKSVRDASLVLNVIAGHDPRDATSVPRDREDFTARLDAELRGMRLAVPREYFGPGIEPGVRSAVRTALDTLQDLGAEVDEVTLPHTDYALAAYYLIAPAEASANLARYDGVKYGLSVPGPATADMWDGFRETRGEGFGPEVKRRIMLGAYALSAGYYDAYYKKAQQTRTLIRRDFEVVFEDYDVVVVPTSPTTAFELGSRIDDPLQMYLSDVLTLSANLAGLPGISVPCGFASGLPVGLQFLGQPFQEATLLQVAHRYEQATAWHTRRPAL